MENYQKQKKHNKSLHLTEKNSMNDQSKTKHELIQELVLGMGN
jgi:hypothetical protein